MKKGTRKKNRIGYMPIDGEQASNGDALLNPDTSADITPTDEMYPKDPLIETVEPIPNDVAVLLNQDIPAQQMPPQLQSTIAPGENPVPDAQPQAAGINWKLVIAIVVIGYFLTKKS